MSASIRTPGPYGTHRSRQGHRSDADAARFTVRSKSPRHPLTAMMLSRLSEQILTDEFSLRTPPGQAKRPPPRVRHELIEHV